MGSSAAGPARVVVGFARLDGGALERGDDDRARTRDESTLREGVVDRLSQPDGSEHPDRQRHDPGRTDE